MKKDVIYIDIEDDITAIIGKLKASAAKIIALVPPKRIGVLQSVVNLKLLQKSALEGGKRVVLITNDQSLISLAAGLSMPVAKNLQSRPEVPVIPALQVNDNNVINGEELPIGDIAAAAGTLQTPASSPAEEISNKVDLSSLSETTKESTQNAKPKRKINIPNFNVFRKKFFLIGAGGLLLILFLIWALVIAPSANITISAKTSAVNIDRTLTLDPSLPASKTSELALKPLSQQIKKSTSIEFDATGSREVGEKASGKVTLNNGSDSNPVTIPAGTLFTAASGHRFTSTTGVTVPGARVVPPGIIAPGVSSVTIAAVDIGPEYNLAAQSYTIQNYSNIGASGDQMAGGAKEKVSVVASEDVNQAKEKLTQADANPVKNDLRQQFKEDVIIIDESFTVEPGQPSVSPKVGEQAKKAKVTIETAYSLLALPRNDVKQVLGDVLKDALQDRPNQSVFSDGSNGVQFQSFQKLSGGTATARLITTGYIGTTIETTQLAQQVTGKKRGEIEQIVNQITGVDKIDIKFSPFWVTRAPSNPDKITIRFTVVNDAH